MNTLSNERLERLAETGHIASHADVISMASELLALRKEREAPLSVSVVQPVMFIDGDISSDDADKLAKIIRGFNEEDERPLAKMARIIRENPHPTNECDMPKAPPAQPVAVPDEATWEDAPANCENVDWAQGCNACRAAMLKGE